MMLPRRIAALFSFLLIISPGIVLSADTTGEAQPYHAGEIQVTARGEGKTVDLTPTAIIIDPDNYQTPGMPQTIGDFLEDTVIFDSREQSNLIPSNDTLYMRGFGPRRFLVAVDGLPVEKSGFGYGNHAVDYAVIPLGLVDDMEIIIGPHSALFPGQAIAGVVNLKTARPREYTETKPELNVASSIGSYDTQTNRVYVHGGIKSFGYRAGYESYATDGYLRHNDSDIDTFFGKMDYCFSDQGFLSLLGSHTGQTLGLPVNNDPGRADYNPDYPDIDVCGYNPDQNPSLDKTADSFRLNGRIPSPLGTVTVGAYYNKEKSDQDSWQYVDPRDPAQGLVPYWFGNDTVWEQTGGKLQDEIVFSENHTTIIGMDAVVGYSERDVVDRHKVLERAAGFLQHQWRALPELTLTGGLRYENITTWIHNKATNRTTGELAGYLNTAEEKEYIKRDFNQVVPKFFGTYEMDNLSTVLRDTSVSLGVSKIWHAPTSGMDLHGNGLPGFHVDPEHGLGVDLIFFRRLVADINMRMILSHYDTKDFIAYNNRKYAKYIPMPGNPLQPGQEYLDARINLDGITKKSVELEFSGHILDNLSFLLGYAYTDFENDGHEPAGKEEVGDRAEHRVVAGLRYNPLPRTTLLLDYEYQSRQTAYASVETSPDQWSFYSIPMDDYHVVDVGIEQRIFGTWGPLQEGRLKLYVNNLFDEEYQDARGYPMTDRYYGASINFSI